jgi:hypothetical protein
MFAETFHFSVPSIDLLLSLSWGFIFLPNPSIGETILLKHYGCEFILVIASLSAFLFTVKPTLCVSLAAWTFDYKVILDDKELPHEMFDMLRDPLETTNLLDRSSMHSTTHYACKKLLFFNDYFLTTYNDIIKIVFGL